MMFGGRELYPSIVDKAAALGYSLIQNHPFLDGEWKMGFRELFY
jgi:death-on-curing protein